MEAVWFDELSTTRGRRGRNAGPSDGEPNMVVDAEERCSLLCVDAFYSQFCINSFTKPETASV